jgi:hypothetical protein
MILDQLANVIIAGRLQSVIAYNISVSGCMIECATLWLKRDDVVRVQLTEWIDASGRVIWSNGSNAGIVFDEVLDDDSVCQLGFDSSDLQIAEMTPRDRFGRRLAPLPIL